MPKPDSRRLALVGPLPPLRGGIAQFDARTMRELREQGHEVTGVSFSRLYPKLLFPGRTQWTGDVEGSAHPWIDTVRPDTWWRTARRLREVQPEALLAAYWSPVVAPALGTIARRVDCPTLGIVHNALPHERLPMAGMLSRWFLQGCDGVLALSEGVADDVRSLGFEGPLVTTPHPTYDAPDTRPSRTAARAALGLPENGPVLLFFGLVRAYKGLDDLVRALPGIVADQPDLTLLVAGEWYMDKEPTQALIRAVDMERHVQILDRYVPDAELATVFACADVVVQPYRSATQSGVLQLAAAHGVPCVVTDVGGLGEPVREFGAGVVVPPADTHALSDGVLDALRAANAERLRRGARAMAASHGWDRFVAAIDDLLIRLDI